jgi:hypothetical protein
VRILGRELADADADARGQMQVVTLVDKWSREFGQQPFGDKGTLLARSFAQDGELVSPEAREGVVLAHCRLHPLSSRQEQSVTDAVSQAVIDQFEAVEVHEEHRDGVAVAVQAGERVAEPVEEERPVRQARQRIVERLVCELFLDASPSRDVVHLGDEVPDLSGLVPDRGDA